MLNVRLKGHTVPTKKNNIYDNVDNESIAQCVCDNFGDDDAVDVVLEQINKVCRYFATKQIPIFN